MKREDNTFIQTHWINRSTHKRSLLTHPSIESSHESPEPYDFDDLKENWNANEETFRKNNIYTPFNKGEGGHCPVISPPPEVFDQEAETTDGQSEASDSKSDDARFNGKKADKSLEMRKRLASNRKAYSSKLKESLKTSKTKTHPSSAPRPAGSYERNESYSVKRESVDQVNPKDFLLKEFLTMLDESSSSEDKAIHNVERVSLVEQDEDSLSRDCLFFSENHSMLKDIVSSMEDGSSNEGNPFKNYFSSHLDGIVEDEGPPLEDCLESSHGVDLLENEAANKDNEPLNENDPSLYSEISSMFSESPSQLDDSDDYLMGDLSSSNLDVSSSFLNDDMESAGYLEGMLPLSERFSGSNGDELCGSILSDSFLFLEESSSLQNLFDQELLIDEEEESKEEDIHPYSKQNDHSLLVKLPVLLSRVKVDVDVMKSVEAYDNIAEVNKIDWTLYSTNVDVVSPSSRLFVSGVLIADIEYVRDHPDRSIQSIKYPFHWEKVVEVNWLLTPELSCSDRKEYTFQSNGEPNGTHREYYQDFVSPIENQLQSFRFIWHDDFDSKSDPGKISIQGNAHLWIDLLQQQYRSYPS